MSRSGGEKGLRGSGAGNLRVPLELDRYVGELFGLHHGCPVLCRTSRQNVVFLLRLCSWKGLHLAMTGEPRGFSRVVAGFSSYNGELGSLICCPSKVQSPFESRSGAGD